MSDNYQAVYDAVSRQFSHAAQWIADAARQSFDLSFITSQAQQELSNVSAEMQRPSVLYRPELTQDGDAWLAIYGDLPTGAVGCGKTPAAAMQDFDRAWYAEAKVPPIKNAIMALHDQTIDVLKGDANG